MCIRDSGIQPAFVAQRIEIRGLNQSGRKIRMAGSPQGRDQRVVGRETIRTQVVLEKCVDLWSGEDRRVSVLHDGRLAQGRIGGWIQQGLVRDRRPALVPDDLTRDRRQVSASTVTGYGKARTCLLYTSPSPRD